MGWDGIYLRQLGTLEHLAVLKSKEAMDNVIGLLLINLVLCHFSVSLSTSSPTLSTLSATLATALLFLGKKRVPVIAPWPIGQTFATSSLTSVPVTVMLSPLISLVQGFLAIRL